MGLRNQEQFFGNYHTLDVLVGGIPRKERADGKCLKFKSTGCFENARKMLRFLGSLAHKTSRH